MSEKQIEVIREKDPYSRIPVALIQDDSLRLQTRMVLIMMLSVRPDWDFSVRGMAKIAHVTKDTMSKMLSELEAAGYVKRKAQARESAGQFAKAGYIVSGRPIFAENDDGDTCHKNYDTDFGEYEPCPDLSYATEPYTINSPQINIKQVITKQVSNPPYNPPTGDSAEKAKPRRTRRKKSVPDHCPERFEQFWDVYPGGGSRMKAAAAWDALKPDDALIDRMAKALKQQMASPQWQDGVGIPHASTWLNGERWTDKLPKATAAPAPASSGGWAPDPEVM